MILYEVDPEPDQPAKAWHTSERAAVAVAKAAGSCVIRVTFRDLPMKQILLAIMNREWGQYLDREELVFANGDHAERLSRLHPTDWEKWRAEEKAKLTRPAHAPACQTCAHRSQNGSPHVTRCNKSPYATLADDGLSCDHHKTVAAADAEADRINEAEMWGDEGRPVMRRA